MISRRVRSARPLPLWLGLAALTTVPVGAASQATPDLDAGGPVELVIEKLVGLGLVEDRLAGLRPYSVAEARRIVEAARARAADLGVEAGAAAWLDHPSLRRLDRRASLVGGMSALSREGAALLVPEDRGTGDIDADVHPLTPWSGGAVPEPGRSLVGTLASLGSAGPVAWSITARGWSSVGGGASHGRAEVVRGSLYATVGGVRLGLGRSTSVWGHGRHGGTLLADRARGLDRIVVSNESPARLPGFLRYVGPTRGELFVARLGASQDTPNSVLVGYTLTARPHPVVEATVSALIESGGRGSPSAPIGERIADHLIIFDWIFNGSPAFLSSNKGTSLALRFRVPQWRNTQLFAEHTIEDPARNLERLFWQHAGWHLGAWIPRLDGAGRLDLRAEWHHGGAELHRHSQFSSGRTSERRILGLGQPDAEEFLIELGVSDGRSRFTLELGLVDRSGDEWRGIIRPTGGLDRLERVVDLSDERWLRAVATLAVYSGTDGEVRIRVGGVRVANSGFVAGAVDHHRLVQLSARLPLATGGGA